MNWLIVIVYLSGCAIMDGKKKELSIKYCLLFGIIGVVCCMADRQGSVTMHVMALLPGSIFLLMSCILYQHIGIGDGIMIVTMGLFVNWIDVVTILFWSFLFLAGAGVIKAVRERNIHHLTIPAAPFLLTGTLCTFAIYCMG